MMDKPKIIKEKVTKFFCNTYKRIRNIFTSNESEQTGKKTIQFKNIIAVFFACVGVFVLIALFLPTEEQVSFREIAEKNATPLLDAPDNELQNEKAESASTLWGRPRVLNTEGSQQSEVNHNTSMIVSPSGGNAKLELSAGTHLRIQIADKFVASQESTPVIAKVIEDATTDSGLSIPASSLLYGEASYNAPSGRAVIHFQKISIPGGAIKTISASVVSSDGMPGLEGKIHSDSAKNSAGQIITTFVSGLAGGAMEKDFFGNSKGGITNGLLGAVSETAKERAQKYGESLKEAREWIEIQSGTECEAIIQKSFKLIESEGY